MYRTAGSHSMPVPMLLRNLDGKHGKDIYTIKKLLDKCPEIVARYQLMTETVDRSHVNLDRIA